MNRDERIARDLLDGLVEKRLDIGAIQGTVNPARSASQCVGLLNQVDGEALVRKG